MSARWVIVKPAPKTARCSGCRRTRNRLAVYRAHDGRTSLCAPCVTRADNPKEISMEYGQCPSRLADGTRCQRSARHKGEHRATLTKKGKRAA